MKVVPLVLITLGFLHIGIAAAVPPELPQHSGHVHLDLNTGQEMTHVRAASAPGNGVTGTINPVVGGEPTIFADTGFSIPFQDDDGSGGVWRAELKLHNGNTVPGNAIEIPPFALSVPGQVETINGFVLGPDEVALWDYIVNDSAFEVGHYTALFRDPGVMLDIGGDVGIAVDMSVVELSDSGPVISSGFSGIFDRAGNRVDRSVRIEPGLVGPPIAFEVVAVPEPSSMLLLAAGIVVFATRRVARRTV